MSAPETEEDARALVDRFMASRDEAAFRRLYRRFTPALYGLALRLLASRTDDAEDVVQETWIRATARLNHFRWESTLRTWLSSILVNCCRERLRHQWRAVDQENAGESPDEASPPLDLSLDLDRAIARLPAGCRAVFVLHDIEGRTHREIGELLEIGAGTSKSQLFYARRQLRAALGDQKRVTS